MAIETRYGQTKEISLEPTSGLVASSCSVAIYNPDGSQLSTVSAVLPTASTTATASATSLALAVASSVGFSVGHRIRVDSQGTIQTPRVARISGNTLHLSSALSHAPAAGDTVRAIRITATLPIFEESKLGTDYRVEWSASDGSASEFAADMLDVVRWPFVSPITGDDVASILAEQFEDRRSDEFIDRIVIRVEDKLKNKLASTGRRAHLYPDATRFREPGLTAARLLLAESGYIPATASAAEWIRALRFEFDDLTAEIIKSVSSPFDENADGAISPSETKNAFRRLRVER